MRCQNCQKFVGLDLQDPEEQNTDFDPTSGNITAEIRIVRVCSECGDELKEAQLTMEGDFDNALIQAHQGDGHELEAAFDSPEAIEEGGGRYAKSYFGASVNVTLTCKCQEANAEPLATLELQDKVAAGEMDEL